MKRKMINSLQGLKFICFIMIFGWHTYNFCNVFDSNYACRAVSFFMILSGFFMSLHYSTKIKNSSFKEHIIFVFHKIKKFYPLYLLSLILLIVRMDMIQIKDNLFNFFKSLFLLQSVFTSNYFSLNGAAWFLSTIVILYLFSYFIFKIIDKTKESFLKSFFGLVIIYFLAYLYIVVVRKMNLNPEYWTYVSPLFNIFQYTIGCFLAYIYNYLCDKKIFLKKGVISKILFTIIDLFVFILYILTIKKMVLFKLDAYSANQFYQILFNVILIFWFSLSKGYLSDLFGSKILRHFGNLEFEFYILHMALIPYVADWNFLNLPGKWFVIYVAVILYIIVLVYKFLLKKTKQKLSN